MATPKLTSASENRDQRTINSNIRNNCSLTPIILIVLLISNGAIAGLNEAYDAYDKKDYHGAYNKFLPPAKKGNAEAQYAIAMLYHMEYGIGHSPSKVISWLTKAANNGHIQGQSLLGAMYYVGQYVKKNNETALHWYKQSAMNGRVDSQHFVGFMYYKGQSGVPADWIESYAWTTIAADQGNERAISQKSILEKKMTKDRLEKAKILMNQYRKLYTKDNNKPNKEPQQTPKSGAAGL